jgi:hypothetical protein
VASTSLVNQQILNINFASEFKPGQSFLLEVQGVVNPTLLTKGSVYIYGLHFDGLWGWEREAKVLTQSVSQSPLTVQLTYSSGMTISPPRYLMHAHTHSLTLTVNSPSQWPANTYFQISIGLHSITVGSWFSQSIDVLSTSA